MKYEFIKVKDLYEALKHNKNGNEIGFTFDNPEDLDLEKEEPTGWYGVALVRNFGGESIIFGDYGIGIINSFYCGDYDLEDLCRMFSDEGGRKYTEDSLVCVDVKDVAKCIWNK